MKLKYIILIVLIVLLVLMFIMYYMMFRKNHQEIYKSNNSLADMLKYAIYFPQFHKIKENDVNFYPGYTDIINLRDLNIPNKETPSHKELYINSINDYDYIVNKNLIKNQIKLLHKYNIDGFATYHYWFSENSITGNRMIMEEVNTKLLDSDLGGKKIFYIWANENWTKESLTNSNNTIIKNEYNDTEEHCKYLIKLFLHNNYLKIDNKPVFFIHHPRMMSESIFNNYNVLLDKLCVDNGFNGIYLRLNSQYIDHKDIPSGMEDKYYDFHPEYKSPKNYSYSKDNSSATFINYKKYIDTVKLPPSGIQTIFFDFDNSARLYKTKTGRNPIICTHNTEKEYINYFNKIKSNVPKILLINVWNEWGEKMHIEPSNEKGNYYLELINNHLNFPIIPKIIHRVFINDNDTLYLDDDVRRVQNTWLELNEGYTQKLWNKNDCRQYLISNFPEEVIEAFDKIIPYAYKSDLFRYCIIYKEGGWYSDWTQECYKYNLLKKLENERNQLIVVFKDRCGYTLEETKPYKHNYISNGFFGAPKENFILKECISQIVENVKNEYYGDNIIIPTGPGLLGDIFCKYYDLSDDIYYEKIYYYIDEKKVIKTKLEKIINEGMPKGNDYRELWKDRKMYRK